MSETAAELLDGLLGGYAGVYFSRKRGAGLLFLAATLLWPAQGAVGLLSACAGLLFARLLGLDRGLIRRGYYTMNALLVGLAVAHRFAPTPEVLFLAVAAALLAVLATAFLQSVWEGLSGMPQLSLAFMAVAFLLYAAGAPAASAPKEPAAWALSLPEAVEHYLKAVAAGFFRSDVLAGALVFAGLLYSSRIAAALSILGFAAGSCAPLLAAAAPPGGLDFSGFNVSLVAVAVGGVYCVPSAASYGLAALAALLCAPLAQWTAAALRPSGNEMFALPFLALTYAFIAALRVRTANARPELVYLPAASPEENLALAQSRQLREKDSAMGLRLPFIGVWQVTQGVNGEHTHQGKWRHALDFTVPAEAPSRAARPALASFPAFGLPVTAAQGGLVSRIVDGLPDNPPGAMDTERNWGNYISIAHPDGSYSLLAHLQKGSIRVKPGDRVVAGELLGHCGNSGRSPTPHLHYHLQRTPEPGGETVPFAFTSFIRLNGETALVEHAVPQSGDAVENPVPSPRVRAAFDFVTGAAFPFEVETAAGRRRETLVAAMDLYGWRYLESQSDGARLYYHLTAEQFYFDYCSAHPGSLLFALRLAASKVPLVEKSGLVWRDALPLNTFFRGPARLGAEFLMPFLPGTGVGVRHSFFEPQAGEVLAPLEARLTGVRTEAVLPYPLSMRELKASAVFCEGKGPMRVRLESAAAGLGLTATRLPG